MSLRGNWPMPLRGNWPMPLRGNWPMSLRGNWPMPLRGNWPMPLRGNWPMSLRGNWPMPLRGNWPMSLRGNWPMFLIFGGIVLFVTEMAVHCPFAAVIWDKVLLSFGLDNKGAIVYWALRPMHNLLQNSPRGVHSRARFEWNPEALLLLRHDSLSHFYFSSLFLYAIHGDIHCTETRNSSSKLLIKTLDTIDISCLVYSSLCLEKIVYKNSIKFMLGNYFFPQKFE